MARYIYVFRKKMKGLEDHVEVSINPEASFQCSVDRRIIPDQWSRLVDYWHSAKFQNHKIVLLQTHNTTIVFQVQAMILQRMSV